MLIQVNSDNHITGTTELVAEVEAIVEASLGRLSEQITRIEVYLRDENSHKSGDDDIRCTMEARLENRPPLAATNNANTVSLAAAGAADKLLAVVEKDLGRMKG